MAFIRPKDLALPPYVVLIDLLEPDDHFCRQCRISIFLLRGQFNCTSCVIARVYSNKLIISKRLCNNHLALIANFPLFIFCIANGGTRTSCFSTPHRDIPLTRKLGVLYKKTVNRSFGGTIKHLL